MVLAAISLPVLVTTAALGIGGSMVRAASSETQRTADLGALAAAANEPVLGRPNASGVPSVPSSLDEPQEQFVPPAAKSPTNSTFYTSGSKYKAIYDAGQTWDRRISDRLGYGPITQPFQASLGSAWTEGCTVAEAQYAVGRARMGRNFAAEHDAGGNPVVPHCMGSAGWNDGTALAGEHIYLLPEMDSTGAYRLQRCLAQASDCTGQLGQSQSSMLAAIGQNFVSGIESTMGINPGSQCLIDPTATGCFFNSTASQALFGSATGSTVQTALRSQWSSVTGTAYTNLPLIQAQLQQLGGLLFGKTTADNACPTALGPASGQNLCDFGINSASMLPSTMSPRVRAIVHHAVDFPFAPSWANGDGDAHPGDFDFISEALARRAYKNAVVVPTLPANFSATYGADVSACLRGTTVLPAALSSLTYTLAGTLPALNTALSVLVGASLNGGSSTCGNAEVDSAASSSFTVDLNPTLAAGQTALVAAAGALNTQANNATNTAIGTAIGKDPAKCNQSPPASWCVNAGDQGIRDLQDIYNPPGGGTAPTAGDVVERAYQSQEPITLVSLTKVVTVPLGACPSSVAGAVCSLSYWVPALDVVPATVAYWDRTHPENTRFQVASTPAAVHGMYKAVLIDPKKATPLCTETNDPSGYCYDQPPA
jgi:hypothetical protein